MKNVMMLLALWGCEPGKINLDGPDDTGEDTDVLDTDTKDTDVDASLAEERTPTLQVPGMAYGLAGMALEEGDFNGDVADDLLVGAPGIDPASPDAVTINPGPGAAYILSGPIRTDTPLASAAVRFYGISDWDGLGLSVAHGDFDADGAHDVAIGGGVVTAATPEASGFVSVSYGPFAEVVPLSLSTVLMRGGAGDRFGGTLAVGDLDRDGVDDLVVGASTGVGEVSFYRGTPTGVPSGAFATFSGAANSAPGLGSALVVADADGDGADDVFVGASGAAYIFLGPIDGDRATHQAEVQFVGANEGDATGASLALADMNDDGYMDALIGAPKSDAAGMDAGAVYLVHGPLQGDMALAAADAVLVGGQQGSAAGTRVAYANDMNNDGKADMIVGAPYYDDDTTGIDAGRGYLVLGPIEGWAPLAEAEYVRGATPSGEFGKALVADTELNGGDRPDVLFAAPWADTAGTRSGNIALLAGE